MDLALSPYHLTTLEPAAMSAFLLARRVVTILPVPPGGETRPALRAAMSHCPRYRRLLTSWLELAPLFDAGVITTLADGHDAMLDARAASARIDSVRVYEPLRALLHDDAIATTDDALDAFSADLLKGGPDPGLALPVVAGLDALAARMGLIAVRAGPTPARNGQAPGSLAQQAEAQLGRTLLTLGLPILSQASARTILRARLALAQPLQALHRAIDAVIRASTSAPTQQTPIAAPLISAARAAGLAYTQAFQTHAAGQVNKDDDRRKRVTEIFASVQLRAVPAESALIAALSAATRAGTPPVRGTPQRPPSTSAPNTTPAQLFTLVVAPTTITLAPPIATTTPARTLNPGRARP